MWQKIVEYFSWILNLIVYLNTELALVYCAGLYASHGSKHSLHVAFQLSSFLKQFINLKFTGVDELFIRDASAFYLLYFYMIS